MIASPLFDPAPALAFLEALGKDPAKTCFRAIHPSRTRGAVNLTGWNPVRLEQLQRDGLRLYVVINNGGHRGQQITLCPALFNEWDDKPLEWQRNAWKELELPEPSLMVATGGKSIHAYWVLRAPVTPERWAPIQARLIAHCGGDPACKDAPRVMRLPGSSYLQPDGTVTGRAEIIHQSDHRYGLVDLALALPEEEQDPLLAAAPAAPVAPSPTRGIPIPDHKPSLPPRSYEEIRAAAECIPQRISGMGKESPHHYNNCRDALCGCAGALAAIGLPEEEALNLLAHKWPSREAAAQVLRSTTTRAIGRFVEIAKEGGWNASVKPARLAAAPAPAAAGGRAPARRRRVPSCTHSTALRCFDQAVAYFSRRCRNTLTRRARLLRIAKALGLASEINRQEITQRILEATALKQGHTFHPLTADDRLAMERPTVAWLLPGLIPARDLTIIGGRPKVGKTRLAIALADAVLNGTEILGSTPERTCPVLLVSDDQADGDTAQMLEALSLWSHPGLVWSRHFRLTEHDLEALLTAIRQHPGALVILDSLRSIARALPHSENDPEIGAALYDLKASVIEAGGTLALVHHCNKAEGLVGTEALSGHSAIAGAANTILTMHYVNGADGRPAKDDPQRRLVREARSGTGFDLVISPTAGRGSFHSIGTFSDWQQQI